MGDTARLSRAAKILLLAGLVAWLFLRGVIPAFTAITDDFPEYFTSATIVHQGQDASKLYDGTWFRAQTRHYGVGSGKNPGEFRPYPPSTALLLVPLTGFKPLTALRIVTLVSLACLICSMFLLSRIFAWDLLDSALFVLASGWALHTGLRFGHPYILISTFCLLGYYLYLKRMPWLAGLCLGVFVPIKYYPLSVLAAFALHRQWRVALGGGIAIAAVALVSIVMLGWQVHQVFVFDVLLNHLAGHVEPGPRFIAVFQSFDTLFDRLFIFDAVRNPHPVLDAPLVRTVAVLSTKGLLVLAAVAALIKLSRGANANAIAPAIGILGILALLIAPGSGTYAFVLLWLPVALLIDYFLCERARVPAYLILCTYLLIGFIPYGYTYPFDGRGGLSVLAFPRLFLMLAMFGVCICAVFLPRSSGEWVYAEVQNA
ncbi:MAG TPA: glycosyltransferase family 87 protein [Steroidobacteraceae bacterium]